MYYHGADVVVVVYDITDWDSLTIAKTWLNGKSTVLYRHITCLP